MNTVKKRAHFTLHLIGTVVSPAFSILQRFTVLLYSENSNLELVDGARMELFCWDNKTMENNLLTAYALWRHAR